MLKSTPSTVMFEDLKRLGVSHVDAASILYDTEYRFGGNTIGERLKKRTLLSRNFIHVAPGTYSRRFFRDFASSAQIMLSRLLKRSKVSTLDDPLSFLEEHFRGEVADKMIDALERYGSAGAEYRNALERIEHGEYRGKTDRLLLYLMLFLVAGCTGSAQEAVDETDMFSSTILNADVRTLEATEGGLYFDEEPEEEDYAIGIIRIFDGMTMKAEHGLHVLPQTEQGVTIGSSGCDITDVDAQVSRKHARIWKEDGRWFIEGLGSTNGIVVISGADRSVHVVEQPRSKRKRGYKQVPYQIEPADMICLGQHTRFLVQVVSVD